MKKFHPVGYGVCFVLIALLTYPLPGGAQAVHSGANYWGDSSNALIDGPDLSAIKSLLGGLTVSYSPIPPDNRPRTILWQDVSGSGVIDGPDLSILKDWLAGDYGELSGNPALLENETVTATVNWGDSIVIGARGKSSFSWLRPGWGVNFEIIGGDCAGAQIYGRDVSAGQNYIYGGEAYEYTDEAPPAGDGYARVKVFAPESCAAGQTIVIEASIPSDSYAGVANNRHPYKLTARDYDEGTGLGGIEDITIMVAGGPPAYVTALEVLPGSTSIEEGSTVALSAFCALSDSNLVDCTNAYGGLNTQWSATGDLSQLSPPNFFLGNQTGIGGTGTVSAVYNDGVHPEVSDVASVTVLDITPPDTTIILSPPNPAESGAAEFSFTCTEPPCAFECQLNSGAWESCSTPQTYTGLTDGNYIFQVRAYDAAGNGDLSPASYEWTVDVAPDTAITSHPQSLTNRTAAAFEFNCTETGCAFQCRLNSSAWASCLAPKAYGGFAESWQALSTINAPEPRAYPEAVWTGSQMLVWGGYNGAIYLSTGGRYDPATASWTATSLVNAPAGRRSQAELWTGNDMIVWGGLNGTDSYLSSGGRYNPATNSWIATNTANAPAARAFMAAVWTDDKMIVWGGRVTGGAGVNTGGIYDPAGNAWTPTSTPTNVPSGRWGPAGVWTGTELIVWGGSGPVNTGGRYNPLTDSWLATSTVNAPAARDKHVAVWTGAQMIVWGGDAGGSVRLNTGGKYDPLADSWTATAITNAPSARWQPAAVWTGTELLVWAGDDGSYSNTGARYNPLADSWSATSLANAPAGRTDFSAVWTGTKMIVWAGSGSGPVYQNDGAIYNLTPLGLADGDYRFEVRATDATGHLDATPAGFDWTIDATPPETELLSHPFNPATSTSAIFNFNCNESLCEFECNLDRAGWSLCSAPGYYEDLLEGPHNFLLRAYDLAGNVDATPANFNWTIDTTPPDTFIDVAPDNPTPYQSASFEFHCSEPGCVFQCRLDSAGFSACDSPQNYSFLSNGHHVFEVRATDPAGLTDATPAVYSWLIDTMEPETIITTAPPNPSNSANPAFEFICNEEACTFQCKLDSGVFSACSSPKTYSGLSATGHAFSVRATDTMNYTDSTPASYSWTIDVTPPNTTILATPPNPSNSSSANFSFSATETGCSFECSLDSAGWTACASPKIYTQLSVGAHAFSVRATDPANNVDLSPASFNWTIEANRNNCFQIIIAQNYQVTVLPPLSFSSTVDYPGIKANRVSDAVGVQSWVSSQAPLTLVIQVTNISSATISRLWMVGELQIGGGALNPDALNQGDHPVFVFGSMAPMASYSRTLSLEIGAFPCTLLWDPFKINNRVAYFSDYQMAGVWRIWSSNLSGGNQLQITNSPDPNVRHGRAVWAPGMEWIAFDYLGSPNGVALVHPDGSHQTILAERAAEASFAPSGKRLIYSCDNRVSPMTSDICSKDLDGTTEQDLIRGDGYYWDGTTYQTYTPLQGDSAWLYKTLYRPRLSPGGTTMVFMAQTPNLAPEPTNADTGQPSTLFYRWMLLEAPYDPAHNSIGAPPELAGKIFDGNTLSNSHNYIKLYEWVPSFSPDSKNLVGFLKIWTRSSTSQKFSINFYGLARIRIAQLRNQPPTVYLGDYLTTIKDTRTFSGNVGAYYLNFQDYSPEVSGIIFTVKMSDNYSNLYLLNVDTSYNSSGAPALFLNNAYFNAYPNISRFLEPGYYQ